MNIIPLSLYALSFINFVLGLVVLSRNVKSRSYQYFAAFACFVGVWSLGLGLFLASNTVQMALVWSKFYYIAAMLLAFFLFLFSFTFPKRTISKKFDVYLSLLTLGLFVAILFIPDFLINEVAIKTTGNEVILDKSGYLIYSLYFAICFGGALLNFIKNRLKSSGSEKQQLTYMFYGILLAGIFGITFNLILPWFGNYKLIWVGPQFLILFVGITSYAIIKHRLFDIRLVVARSIAYLMLLSTIAGLYGLSVFAVTEYFFSHSQFTTTQQAVYIALAVFVAFTFQPLKRFFDRITNRIFYRDAYDSQKVINHLSELLASEMKLVRIARQSLTLIVTNLHVYYGLFVVMDKGEIYEVERKGQVPGKIPSNKELESLNQTIILRDENKHENRVEVLKKYNAAASLQLKTKEGIVGYILLGQKQSGNIYTQQDIDFLRIVANELSIAVENARNFEQIQAFNETLQKRVDEATKKLRRTNKKLRKLDEAKDEFITMASHQLRTPLTTIKGYVSMMLEGDAGKITEKQRDMLKAAYTSSDRMVYLIADLLNVSRLSTGKFVIQTKRMNLADVVRSEIDQLERHLEAKDLKVEFNSPEHMPPVELDENKTRQVIMNFIDNAIYYTPEGGQITITLEEKDQSIELRVKDTGIGVPKEEQHQLFTKFFRATNAKKARPDGTGLGLYLARKVVAAQGGTIIFESEEGEGSTFGFSFPKDRVLLKSSEESPAESEETVAA